MTNFGYTLMTEQSGPKDLVRWAVEAERAGFDFEVSSDHYSPWQTQQGHAPYAWSVLGAVAQATQRVGLMSYVTCPTIRYRPAPDLDAIVEAVRPYWEAGFTDVALVQVGGGAQQHFLAEAAEPLLERLRSAAS